MANELTLNLDAQYSDTTGGVAAVSIVDQFISSASQRYFHGKQQIPITVDTLIARGGVTGAQLWVIVNRDPTNFVTIKPTNGGLAIAKLLPGRFCVIPPGADFLTPYAVADTAACEIEVLLIDT